MRARAHPGSPVRVREPFPVIPSCDHYIGSEKSMARALEPRDRIGPVFDLTRDCKDGAQADKAFFR